MDLGMAKGGDIDSHVFYDAAGSKQYYLLWKTDDNNVGLKTTRIFAQGIQFSKNSSTGALEVKQVGNRVELLDSTGLWWSDSSVAGGTLIEGPEVVYEGGFYYLFFASGRFCEDSYSEGVARSKNLLGPYEKMKIPLLSTGMVGNTVEGKKLIGPGHASYLKDKKGRWYSVFHASLISGPACEPQRYPWVSALGFTDAKWPYINFE